MCLIVFVLEGHDDMRANSTSVDLFTLFCTTVNVMVNFYCEVI